MKIRIAFRSLFAPLLAMLTVPASAGVMGVSTLFSDLGPSGNVYQCCSGWTISGTGTLGTSFTAANEFNAGVGGSVSQIDLGVGYVTGSPQFYASIWTDLAGTPGTQVADAFWNNLISTETVGNCCGLVTISGITGVTLNAGTNYFMILGPEDLNDTSWNGWNWNSVGATGLDLYSNDGGISWVSSGVQPMGAFDVIGASVPEPCFSLLIGTGLLGVLGAIRRKPNR